MPKAMSGVLVTCDPSIKSIIMKINAEHNHDIIIEEIDDENILVKTQRHEDLKIYLRDALKDTVKEPDESSESE